MSKLATLSRYRVIYSIKHKKFPRLYSGSPQQVYSIEVTTFYLQEKNNENSTSNFMLSFI